jgi:hypothetical protein
MGGWMRVIGRWKEVMEGFRWGESGEGDEREERMRGG